MSRAVVVLGLLVVLTTALRLTAAWEDAAPAMIGCSLCHD
jgi:hypothetical protein